MRRCDGRCDSTTLVTTLSLSLCNTHMTLHMRQRLDTVIGHRLRGAQNFVLSWVARSHEAGDCLSHHAGVYYYDGLRCGRRYYSDCRLRYAALGDGFMASGAVVVLGQDAVAKLCTKRCDFWTRLALSTLSIGHIELRAERIEGQQLVRSEY